MGDTVALGSEVRLYEGRCWRHKGVYLGKYINFKLVGARHDPDPHYTFEKGIHTGLGLLFSHVACDDSPNRNGALKRTSSKTKSVSKGGMRRNKKRITRKH